MKQSLEYHINNFLLNRWFILLAGIVSGVVICLATTIFTNELEELNKPMYFEFYTTDDIFFVGNSRDEGYTVLSERAGTVYENLTEWEALKTVEILSPLTVKIELNLDECDTINELDVLYLYRDYTQDIIKK